MEHTVHYEARYLLPFNKSLTADASRSSSHQKKKKAMQTYLSNSKYK
jgi:hypothetical protein